mgnify:CR=1 FL=1
MGRSEAHQSLRALKLFLINSSLRKREILHRQVLATKGEQFGFPIGMTSTTIIYLNWSYYGLTIKKGF